MTLPDRLLGRFTGRDRGPLIVLIGAMHGNETAGVVAIRQVFDQLEALQAARPDFSFRGRLIGLLGNRRAFVRGERYLKYDLNRQFKELTISGARQEQQPQAEHAELLELIDAVDAEIADYQPERLVVLDVHTTSAPGGIFVITPDDRESLLMGVNMHAPVVKGLLAGLTGTSLHYFRTERMGLPTQALTFEAGQHTEPESVNRAVAAIINLLRSVKAVGRSDLPNENDRLLIEFSRGLPRISELIMVYRIGQDEKFEMRPGYRNFQTVSAGEQIARDRNGPVYSVADGYLLMPLYQKQGDEGFFLLREYRINAAF
jgi:succinylglutamate desuccinylase